MKKDNLLKGAAVLGALALMAGGVVAADAAVNNATDTTATTNTNTTWEGRGGNGGRGFENSLNGLTAEEKAAKIAEMEANRTANQATREAKQTAVEAAITAGDYDAWVTAEGTNSPVVSKVTKDNFPKFVEAHNLMTQAHTILAGIGLEDGAGKGLGMGMGFGGGHMMNQ
jgi:hypothetical protein